MLSLLSSSVKLCFCLHVLFSVSNSCFILLTFLLRCVSLSLSPVTFYRVSLICHLCSCIMSCVLFLLYCQFVPDNPSCTSQHYSSTWVSMCVFLGICLLSCILWILPFCLSFLDLSATQIHSLCTNLFAACPI